MKYKSSLTKEVKLTILLLALFWGVNILAIINSSFKDVIIFSLFMCGFGIVYVSFLLKGIYIIIENDSVKYIQMFVLRKTVEIEKINKIQKGLIGGLYTSLLLVYQDNGNINNIKITTLTFKKNTLKQFVSDLKIQNPRIEIEQSVEDFFVR